jgi:hypothetical protein
MPKDKVPQNLRRVEETLSGEEIAKLNETFPGLGNKLHRILSLLGTGISAQAGHKGVVGIRAQKGTDSRGRPKPSMDLQGGRISDMGDALDNQDAVTLKQIRRLIDPENLKQLLSKVDPSEIGTQGPPGAAGGNACTAYELRDRRKATTGLSDAHSVHVLNEFVYVFGVNGADPTLELYRINAARDLAFVDSIVLTQELRRTCLHGDHIYGAVDGASSTVMFVISVDKPDAMAEVGSLDVSEVINDIHVQGLYAWLGTAAGVIAVNISNPNEPVMV